MGEDGTLELLAPATVALRTNHAEALPIPPGFQQRFGTAYRHELQAWIAGADRGPAAVSEAAVQSLETGRPVDVRLA